MSEQEWKTHRTPRCGGQGGDCLVQFPSVLREGRAEGQLEPLVWGLAGASGL